MYEQFYEFNERPFSLLPDPDFLFLSEKHRTGLDMLELAVFNHSGFCVVSGDIGAGKTTLIRELLNRLDDSICTGLVSNTHASFGTLMQWIMAAYELRCDSDDPVELHRQFMDFVIRQYAAGKHTLLIIDEAQNLSLDAMEELRMLSNVNTEKDLVLQVILVGQAELREKLEQPELRQFLQRIAINYHLTGLSREETAAYIRHRIVHAGGSADLFDVAACDAVYHFSNGVPRLINRICDLGLVYGYSEASPVIGAALVAAVAGEHWPGEFPELPGEIVSQPGAEPAKEPVEQTAVDFELQADLRPVREHTVVQAADAADLPSMDRFTGMQDRPEERVPPDRSRAAVATWLVLALVVSGAGVLWWNQNAWLVPSDSPESVVEPENETARIEQQRLEALQQREAERNLALQQEAARAEQKQHEQAQRQAEQAQREQAQRQAEQERLAQEKLQAEREQERLRRVQQQRQAEEQLARQREAERLERERNLAKQREAERLAHEQALANKRMAARREQQRLATERRRAEQRQREEKRKQQLAEREKRRAAARAALEQMRDEISWTDDD